MRHDAQPVMATPGYADKEPTKPPDWHGLVVWDVFFNALTTGLFLVAAVGDLAAPAAFGPVAVWAYPVALVLLLIDLTCLVLDLGDPLRFHHMLRVFKPSSPMSLGTWCLTAYSFPLALLVGVDLLVALGWLSGDAAVGWVRVGLLVAALPFAFGSMAYKGVLFSTTSQPGWRDARWLGGYHTASAVAFGCAVLLLLAGFTGHNRAAAVLRPAFAAALVFQLVPLGLLLIELKPTLVWRYGTPAFRGIVAAPVGGALLPLPFLLLNAGPWLVSAAVVAFLASGFLVRHVLIGIVHHAPAVRPPAPR